MALAKRIIPCLDVDRSRWSERQVRRNPRCRRSGRDRPPLRRGRADEITFLDITASSDDRETMVHVVERVASEVFIPLTVGGGIRVLDDVRRMLNAGADKVSINTAAIARPEFVREAAERFGNQCIVVAIDAKAVYQPDELPRWEIFTHGGRRPTGIDAVEWARRMNAYGAGNPADQHGPRRHQTRFRLWS